MKHYPLFMDLAGRPCLVVGAGAVAARKARSLLECGARVTVVGDRPAAAFRSLERSGVRLKPRRFRAADVAAQALVIAATDDRRVNAAVAAAAKRRGIPVNAVDDPPNCTFIVPAVVRRGDLTIAVSTGGKSPAAARLVKERIAATFGKEYADLVRLLGRYRGRMKDQVPGQECRAKAWERMLEEGVLESLRRGDCSGAEGTVRRCLHAAGCRGGAGGRERAGAPSGRRGGAQRGSPAPTAAPRTRRPSAVDSTGVPAPPARPAPSSATQQPDKRRAVQAGKRKG